MNDIIQKIIDLLFPKPQPLPVPIKPPTRPEGKHRNEQISKSRPS